MKIQNTYRDRIIFAVLGFGLAGAIWGGWDLYGGEPSVDYPLTIFGAIFLGILGGLGLALPGGNAKSITRVVGLGLVGAVLGIFAASAGVYNLPIVGSFLFSVFPSSLAQLTRLDPNLPISVYWLNFAVAGAFMGLFWGLGLKKKWLTMTVRGAVGFGLAAILGPIIGNLVGDLFSSLLVSYIITFTVIGAALGLSLTLQIGKKEKEGSRSQ